MERSAVQNSRSWRADSSWLGEDIHHGPLPATEMGSQNPVIDCMSPEILAKFHSNAASRFVPQLPIGGHGLLRFLPGSNTKNPGPLVRRPRL